MIRTREQLLEFLADRLKRVGRRHVARAIECGKVEVLGGFLRVPPSDSPGWIVRAVSDNGETYHAAVMCPFYGVRMVDVVPWHHWAGGMADHPDRYRRLRDTARRFKRA
jgi:hypothetical protein